MKSSDLIILIYSSKKVNHFTILQIIYIVASLNKMIPKLVALVFFILKNTIVKTSLYKSLFYL